MARIAHWTLLAVLGLALAVSGCVYNDDDDGDDDSGGGGVTYDGGGGDNNDDDAGTVSGEARGSPGWGLMGSLAALATGIAVLRRRK